MSTGFTINGTDLYNVYNHGTPANITTSYIAKNSNYSSGIDLGYIFNTKSGITTIYSGYKNSSGTDIGTYFNANTSYLPAMPITVSAGTTPSILQYSPSPRYMVLCWTGTASTVTSTFTFNSGVMSMKTFWRH